jgi:hypothetical protein
VRDAINPRAHQSRRSSKAWQQRDAVSLSAVQDEVALPIKAVKSIRYRDLP